MTKEEIKERYKALILPENRNPYHFEKVEAPISIDAYNPMCGDKYELYLDEADNHIQTAHFHGFGCAMSKASTSILVKELEGMSNKEAKEFITEFLSVIATGENLDKLSEPLQVLAELKNFEGRIDCIQLSWKAVLEQLERD